MTNQPMLDDYKASCLELFRKARVPLTSEEAANLEIVDFGLGDFERTGLCLVTYVNTARVCAKELALLPGQNCPEHRHPPLGTYAGKEETFRCRYGTVYLYVEGESAPACAVRPPELGREYYTVFHEIVLRPGEQHTLLPNTRHWFVAGEQGAVVSEFSTPSYDDSDVFTNPAIDRTPLT